MRAAGFQEHGVARVAERCHQRQSISLKERFTASKFDERKPIYRLSRSLRDGRLGSVRSRQTIDFTEDFRHFHFPALGESIRSVAIRAAQIAGGQPDENARQTSKGAFPLQAQIDFIDYQRF